MDSFVRSESIQALLNNGDQITPEQLDQAIKLGLNDEDFQINESTWNFLLKKNLWSNYSQETTKMAKRFMLSNEIYYLKLGQKILSFNSKD